MAWPKNPIIYEINTWVWLHDLCQRYRRPITLANVPSAEWDAVAALGFDAVWLMGVWERSPVGTRIAREEGGLKRAYYQALPDFSPEDVVGSPYCVRRYVVDGRLGGQEGLAAARRALAARDLRLLLDLVPNHVASDNPWVLEHPEYFIQGDAGDKERAPYDFFEAEGKFIAHARDPNFPPWSDSVQLNAFNSGLRGAMVETLHDIGTQCDGVRCDMAMLLVNRVFTRTWGQRAGDPLESEFWNQVIPAVREKNDGFLFLAEVYWDMEWELLQQGFDYCYDKRLYDRLVHENAESVRLHLQAELPYQEKLVRFIENHDESRAAAAFGLDRSRAVAVAMATVPGARLFHEGQLEGRRVRVPVQLGRRTAEGTDSELLGFYRVLLESIHPSVLRDGEWQMCERRGWPDNDRYRNLLAWSWRKGGARRLIVVNLSESGAEGSVHLPWDDLRGRSWQLTDVFTGEVFMRDGDEMQNVGLYVGLAGWGFHFLEFA